MRKYCSGVRRCATVLALALMLGIQAGGAHAEEPPDPIIENPVDPGDIVTLPTDPIDPGGTTEPGATDPATTDPGTTDPGTSGSETSGPGTSLPGTTLPGTTVPGGGSGGTATKPLEPGPNPAPAAPAGTVPAPFVVEQPAGQFAQEPGAGQVVPLPESPNPTASNSTAPSVKPSAPVKTSAPVPLPEPVAKTLDSVVSVATGSPLHVQIITVLALLGAGFVYFRFMGSKSRRPPVRSHK